MAVRNEERDTSFEKQERLVLGFLDNEKVDGILNEIFPKVIIVSMSNSDMSKILINDTSSCNIMYVELF